VKRRINRRRLWRRHSGGAALLALLLVSPAPAADWPMLAQDAARGGGAPASLQPPFARKWYRLFPDEGIQSGVQPVIVSGKVYLGTLRGALHAMEAATGKDLWVFQAGGPILHAAAADGEKVFFGAADGKVYALNTGDGGLAWTHRTGAAVWNAPALHGGLLLVGSRDGRLYALEAATGRLRWSAETGAPLLNSPAVDAKRNRVYIGSESMRVHAFALADGRPLWRSEPLPGASLRGYHPVIAPDGAVMVTSQPVIGYDRFQNLLLEMVREVFGDFASWRHNKEDNARLRAANFRLMEDPATYRAQLEFLRRRLAAEPGYQTFFVLDSETGRQRFVAPIVASESMNGPGAPPLVTPDGRVIVKYQVLLRSRYEHYSPFLNVGWLDTTTGHVAPLMDQTRTYGWHDSLLLVHDEQCQLSFAGRLLLNTHQDNVNALDLDTLKGLAQPLALNIHEPARGEAAALRLEAFRGRELSPGNEWLIRGTAVYGGGSVLDTPVAIADDTFYYLPTHELNSGCALIAYSSQAGAPAPKRTPPPALKMGDDEWRRLQDQPWDWDTLATARLKNFLEALPGAVPGSAAAPLTAEAEKTAAAIPDRDLDEFIWRPAMTPPVAPVSDAPDPALRARLATAVAELLSQPWRPWVTPAAKAPEEAYRFFNDPSETLYTLLLARPFLEASLQRQADARAAELAQVGLRRAYDPEAGASRVPYEVPTAAMRIVDEIVRDDLARLYPLWLWSAVPPGADFAAKNWTVLRSRLHAPASKVDDDCGNGRLAGLMAYCRLARAASDPGAVEEALPLARRAMRARLIYELAHPRGGLIRPLPNGRAAFVRWRRLTPDVAAFLSAYARPVARRLMADYVDFQRPAWWLAWNIEQLMRNEAPFQQPTTPLEIFTARALLLDEPAATLQNFLDIPWCRADEFYIQKLALLLRQNRPR